MVILWVRILFIYIELATMQSLLAYWAGDMNELIRNIRYTKEKASSGVV